MRHMLSGAAIVALLTVVLALGAVPAQAAAPPNYFGTNVHPRSHDDAFNDRQIDEMWLAGVKTVRIDVNWCDIEAYAKGLYRYDYLWPLDRYVNRLVERGMEPMMMVTTTPRWARNTGTAIGCGPAPPAYKAGEYSVPPTYAIDYADFLAFLVKRYNGKSRDEFLRPIARVPTFEVWGEPDGYWAWTQGGSQTDRARRYTELLKAAFFKAKAADARVRILGAVASNAGPNPRAFLAGVLLAGGLTYMDALSVHLYNDEGSSHQPYGTPEQLFDQYYFYLYSLLLQTNQDKPVWLTEVGYNTSTFGAALLRKDYLYRTYVQSLYRFGPAPGVRFPIVRALTYMWNDGPSDHWEDRYGLVGADGTTHKPAYDAFYQLAHAAL